MGLFRKKKRLDDGFIDMVRAHDNGESLTTVTTQVTPTS